MIQVSLQESKGYEGDGFLFLFLPDLFLSSKMSDEWSAFVINETTAENKG